MHGYDRIRHQHSDRKTRHLWHDEHHFHGVQRDKRETKVACNTEGDANEAILTNGNFTLFNALNAGKTELEPGIGITLTATIRIRCGAASIAEVKGTDLGTIIGASLTVDTTDFDSTFYSAPASHATLRTRSVKNRRKKPTNC